jgi:hypothetical protein
MCTLMTEGLFGDNPPTISAELPLQKGRWQ